MTVVAPPPQTDADERTLDERVADLEALIEEARQRTRRRRRRNGAVALAALLAAGAALYAGGDGIPPMLRCHARSRRRVEHPDRPAGLLGGRRPPPDEARCALPLRRRARVPQHGRWAQLEVGAADRTQA